LGSSGPEHARSKQRPSTQPTSAATPANWKGGRSCSRGRGGKTLATGPHGLPALDTGTERITKT
jgi:hypothetical protein